jgi:molybdate transport system ATP-binding protein
MSVEARFTIQHDSFQLTIDMTLADGEVLAVLGPNGSGKSTLLNALSGLQPIDSGTIQIDGNIVDDVDRSTFVLPEHRHVGVMFQNSELFETMSVIDNVAFGLRAHGENRNAARSAAAEWLKRFSLESFAHRRPASLSGGQAQRVALARALATRPNLLLLDEPTSALDVRAKAEIRRDLLQLRREHPVTTLLVTHDPLDAFALADRVIVLEEGRIVQSGALDEVASHPQSRHIADMVGLSLVRGEVRNGTLTTAANALLVVPADTPEGPSVASIRPASVSLHRRQPEGSARNAWEMAISDLDRHPDRVRARLTGPIPLLAELTPAGADALSLAVGDTLWASVKASEVTVTPDLLP